MFFILSKFSILEKKLISSFKFKKFVLRMQKKRKKRNFKFNLFLLLFSKILDEFERNLKRWKSQISERKKINKNKTSCTLKNIFFSDKFDFKSKNQFLVKKKLFWRKLWKIVSLREVDGLNRSGSVVIPLNYY